MQSMPMVCFLVSADNEMWYVGGWVGGWRLTDSVYPSQTAIHVGHCLFVVYYCVCMCECVSVCEGNVLCAWVDVVA